MFYGGNDFTDGHFLFLFSLKRAFSGARSISTHFWGRRMGQSSASDSSSTGIFLGGVFLWGRKLGGRVHSLFSGFHSTRAEVHSFLVERDVY